MGADDVADAGEGAYQRDVPSTSLRGGTAKVAMGLAFFGLATYAFTALVLRALGPAQFSDFNLYWGVAYGLGLGAMIPFEQEVSRRATAAAHTAGRIAEIVSPATAVAVAFAATLAVATIPFALQLAQGQAVSMWVASTCTFFALGIAYVSRGALAGAGRFARYSGQLFAEGTARLVLAVIALIVGATSPWSYAAFVPLALVLAVLVTFRSRGLWERTSWQAARDVAASVAPLVLASVISFALVNLGPVAVRYIEGPHTANVVGSYLAAAFIARLPIFAFAAVQAVLIPRLTRAVIRRDAADFRRSVGRVLMPTLLMGLAAVAGIAVVGQGLLRVLAGPQYALPTLDMVLLTSGYACYLITLVLQPAAVSLGRHRESSAVWLLGSLTFALAWILPTSATTAVSVAIATVSLTVSAGLAAVVYRGMPSHGRRET